MKARSLKHQHERYVEDLNERHAKAVDDFIQGLTRPKGSLFAEEMRAAHSPEAAARLEEQQAAARERREAVMHAYPRDPERELRRELARRLRPGSGRIIPVPAYNISDMLRTARMEQETEKAED